MGIPRRNRAVYDWSMRVVVTWLVVGALLGGCASEWTRQVTMSEPHRVRVPLADNRDRILAEYCVAKCETSTDRANCLAICPDASVEIGSCTPAERPPASVCFSWQGSTTRKAEGRCREPFHVTEEQLVVGCTERGDKAPIAIGIVALIGIGLVGALILSWLGALPGT